MNIRVALNNANEILKKNNIKTHKLDSEVLMCKAVKKDRSFLILNSSNELMEKDLKKYDGLIKKRSKGEPIAYLVCKKDFWKYQFDIKKDVLVPRPETELIVEEVLKLTKNKSKLNILDIGVGSGCLLLSILKEKKEFNGTGIDISKKCIELTKINSSKLGLNNRVKLFKTDVDNFAYGKYDLIISNPPYINKLGLKNLEKDIVSFEPILALNGGLDGISEIRKVIKKSSELIKLNGKLILEIAFDQRDKVSKLLKSKGFYINKVLKDFSNFDRCIVSTKI